MGAGASFPRGQDALCPKSVSLTLCPLALGNGGSGSQACVLPDTSYIAIVLGGGGAAVSITSLGSSSSATTTAAGTSATTGGGGTAGTGEQQHFAAENATYLSSRLTSGRRGALGPLPTIEGHTLTGLTGRKCIVLGGLVAGRRNSGFAGGFENENNNDKLTTATATAMAASAAASSSSDAPVKTSFGTGWLLSLGGQRTSGGSMSSNTLTGMLVRRGSKSSLDESSWTRQQFLGRPPVRRAFHSAHRILVGGQERLVVYGGEVGALLSRPSSSSSAFGGGGNGGGGAAAAAAAAGGGDQSAGGQENFYQRSRSGSFNGGNGGNGLLQRRPSERDAVRERLQALQLIRDERKGNDDNRDDSEIIADLQRPRSRTGSAGSTETRDRGGGGGGGGERHPERRPSMPSMPTLLSAHSSFDVESGGDSSGGAKNPPGGGGGGGGEYSRGGGSSESKSAATPPRGGGLRLDSPVSSFRTIQQSASSGFSVYKNTGTPGAVPLVAKAFSFSGNSGNNTPTGGVGFGLTAGGYTPTEMSAKAFTFPDITTTTTTVQQDGKEADRDGAESELAESDSELTGSRVLRDDGTRSESESTTPRNLVQVRRQSYDFTEQEDDDGFLYVLDCSNWVWKAGTCASETIKSESSEYGGLLTTRSLFPPARARHSTTPVTTDGEYCVVFGGYKTKATAIPSAEVRERGDFTYSSSIGQPLNDAWQLKTISSSSDDSVRFIWKRLENLGAPPSARWGHTAIGICTGAMVVYGGCSETVDVNGPRHPVNSVKTALDECYVFYLGGVRSAAATSTLAEGVANGEGLWLRVPGDCGLGKRVSPSSTVMGGAIIIFGGYRGSSDVKETKNSESERFLKDARIVQIDKMLSLDL